MAIPVALIALGKSIIAKAVYTKVTKEIDRGFEKIESKINTDGDIVTITDTIEEAVLSKGKISAWAVVAVSLTGFAEVQGWLPPSVSQLIQSLLSNPEVIESIEHLAE